MNMEKMPLPWCREIWNRIGKAIHDEMIRVEITPKFLPLHGPLSEALTVPADPIGRDSQGKLFTDEALVTPLCEIWSEIALTPQQVRDEAELMKARTLVIRAANFVARGQDALIFNGDMAEKTHPLFLDGRVRKRSGPIGGGLLNTPVAENQIIRRGDLPASASNVEEQLFAALTEGYARLQNAGHYGPYSLILNTETYAAAYSPIPNSFIFEADRLKPLVGEGLFTTGTLPPVPFAGLLVSLGGATMDLVVGKESHLSYLQEDDDGKYRFRVWRRFAFRFHDPTAVIRMEFKVKAKSGKADPSRTKSPGKRLSK